MSRSLMKSGRRKMLALRLDDDGKETWKMPKDVVMRVDTS
jgi:hypothetical protein